MLGTVADGDGSPVEGAEVSSLTHSGNRAVTDAEGRFRLELRYEKGAVALAATREGYSRGETVIPAAGAAGQDEVEAELRMERLGGAARLEGRITGPDGEGLAGQTVHIDSPSLGALQQADSGPDGAYSLGAIRPAPDYRVWLSPPRGFHDWSRSPVELAEGDNRLDIALTALETGRLSGVMVDPQGRPVARLTLWARSLSANANLVALTGDEAGRFEADDVPAGDLYLETRAAPLVSVRGLRLEPGESKEVEVPVGLGEGRLTGTVAGPGGAPVPGARITLSWSGSRGPLQTSVFREGASDASGAFRFSGLCRGRGTLTASAPRYREWRKSLDLQDGMEEWVTLEEAPR